MQNKSLITCPQCGFHSEEEMDTNTCRYFYQCRECGMMLRPLPGDCCVFCSYGTVPCPPVQISADSPTNGGSSVLVEGQ